MGCKGKGKDRVVLNIFFKKLIDEMNIIFSKMGLWLFNVEVDLVY